MLKNNHGSDSATHVNKGLPGRNTRRTFMTKYNRDHDGRLAKMEL